MILFGFYTGQRLGDIASLTWGNLDLTAGEIRLTTRKTGRRQTLPLPSPLRTHIATMDAGDDPQAPSHTAAFRIVMDRGRSAQLSNEFARLLESVGLRTSVAASEGSARAKHALSFRSCI